MKKYAPRAVAAVAAATLAASLVACSTPTATPEAPDTLTAGDPTAPELDSVRTAVWQGTITAAFWQAKDILDEDYGVAAEFDWITDIGAARAQLASGELDLLPLGPANIYDLIASGVDMRIIANSHNQREGVVTLETLDPEISGIEDLKGKTVGTVVITGPYINRIKVAGMEAGLGLDDITFVQVPYGEMAAALDGGIIDAAVVQGFSQFQAKQLGSEEVFDIGGGEYSERAENVWAVSAEFFDANPNTVAAYQCAIDAGAVIADDREVVETFLKDAYDFSDDVIAGSKSVHFPVGSVDVSSLAADFEDRVTVGDIPDDGFDWAAYVVPLPDNC